MGEKYIIGMGNYAKNDDGIGLHIIESIMDNNLDKGFNAIELRNDGMGLLTFFNENSEKILVVDCALIDKKPGEYLIFTPDDVETQKVVGNVSTHEGDILKLIALAKELDYFIPEIKIMAIQPESLDMEMRLSDCLNSKLDSYIQAAIKEITS